MDSDEYDHGNDNCQKDPPAQLNALFKISNTGCHRSTTANMQASTTTDQTNVTDTISSFVIPNIRVIRGPQKIFTEDSEGNEDLDFSLENLR